MSLGRCSESLQVCQASYLSSYGYVDLIGCFYLDNGVLMLGNNPLTLKLAISYLRYRKRQHGLWSIEEYLSLWSAQQSQHQEVSSSPEIPPPISTALSISHTHLLSHPSGLLSSTLLQIFARFHHVRIPKSIFTRASNSLHKLRHNPHYITSITPYPPPPLLSALLSRHDERWDATAFNTSINLLLSLGFITLETFPTIASESEASYTLHTLIGLCALQLSDPNPQHPSYPSSSSSSPRIRTAAEPGLLVLHLCPLAILQHLIPSLHSTPGLSPLIAPDRQGAATSPPSYHSLEHPPQLPPMQSPLSL
jgi:hypothetical protein